MPSETADSVLRDIWREQMHVEPRLLERLPRALAARLPHVLAPAETLTRELRCLPLGILTLWRDGGRGHILFTVDKDVYLPGQQRWRRGGDGPSEDDADTGACVGLCLVSVREVMRAPMPPPLPVLAFLDHLLGSGAEAGGGLFSRGSGCDASLSDAACRYVAVEARRYGHETVGASGPEDYLARTMWLYAHDRGRLSVLDPLLGRLYAGTLFSQEFWGRRAASR